MIPPDAIQKGPSQIQFSLTIVESGQTRLDSDVTTAEQSGSGRPGELTLSGSQVLLGSISALCTVGLLLWVLIRLWLFEQ